MPDPASQSASRKRPLLLLVLAVILVAETALVAGAAVWLLVELVTVVPGSYAGAVAVLVLAVLTAVWIGATVVGLLRLQNWSRASGVTIQVIQIAVAVGCFQGLFARPALGWALLIPALVAGVLALVPAVVRATASQTGGSQ